MKTLLNKALTAFAFLIIASGLNAQQVICLGQDATICSGDAITIQNCGGAPGGGSGGIVMSNPTSVNLSDDQWSPAVPIGFNFDFYGNTHTQLVIGSNGVISFDLANANGYCPWALGGVGALPSAGFNAAHNSIMAPYQDINPNLGGTISYETLGTAPNRIFVVLYSDTYFFQCNTICNYIAVVLYEGSNNVETHFGDKPLCSTWNGGLAIHGTQNPGGTVAHIYPGRNNTQWAANQEGTQWTPTAPNNTTDYTINPIPYMLVTSPNTSFQWEDTEGNTYPYNGGSVTLQSPFLDAAGNPLDSIGVFMSGSACGASLGGVTDTSWIYVNQALVSASGIDDICTAGVGEVTATPLAGQGPYTYDWTTLGNATTQTVQGVFAGNHTVIMTDALGCTATATVTIGDIPAAFGGSTTVVSCPGGNDGTAFAEMIPVLGNVTYEWFDAAGNPIGQTTQTATGLTAGQYTCVVTSDIGCQQSVVLDVTEIPGMVAVIANQQDATCNSAGNGIVEVSVADGTAPYTYAWDNSASTTNIATDLFAGTHTVTITDANGCIITISATIGEPNALDITSITPNTQICPEDDIMLSAVGAGGSSPYTFTWYQDGVEIATGSDIMVDPDFTNTEYCVILSEQCGSPTDQECSMITFPTPIEPRAIVDEEQKCMPGRFEFTDNSVNAGEIATTFWEFGDEAGSALELTGDSTHYAYNAVGVFDFCLLYTSPSPRDA